MRMGADCPIKKVACEEYAWIDFYSPQSVYLSVTIEIHFFYPCFDSPFFRTYPMFSSLIIIAIIIVIIIIYNFFGAYLIFWKSCREHQLVVGFGTGESTQLRLVVLFLKMSLDKMILQQRKLLSCNQALSLKPLLLAPSMYKLPLILHRVWKKNGLLHGSKLLFEHFWYVRLF